VYIKSIKNIVSIALSDALTRGIFILFSVVVARATEKNEFAIFSLAVTLGIYFRAVVDGGITGHSIKLVARSKADQWADIIGTATITRLVLSVVFSLVVVLALYLLQISVYEASVYAFSLMYIVAVSIFPAWFSRGVQDNVGYFQSYLIVALMVVVALTGFYVSDINPDQGALPAIIWRNISWAAGAVVALLWILKRNGIALRYTNLKVHISILRETYPLGVAAILYSFIPIFPQLVLRIYGLTYDLALYASVWVLQVVLIAVASMLAASVLPMLSKHMESMKNLGQVLKTHFVLVVLAGVLVSFLWWVLGGDIVVLFYGAGYRETAELMPVFSIIILLVFCRASLDMVLVAFGYYKIVSITGLASILIMGVAVVFMVEVDFVSAARVYLLGEAVLLLMNFIVISGIKWTNGRDSVSLLRMVVR